MADEEASEAALVELNEEALSVAATEEVEEPETDAVVELENDVSLAANVELREAAWVVEDKLPASVRLLDREEAEREASTSVVDD